MICAGYTILTDRTFESPSLSPRECPQKTLRATPIKPCSRYSRLKHPNADFAIKRFFPNAWLFGFTGTPIFEENANYRIREDQYETYKTTEAIFEKWLHAYTITHAIEDRNVLKFHIDYFKGKGDQDQKPGREEKGVNGNYR